MKHELENDIWESFLKNSVIEYSLKELEKYPSESQMNQIILPPRYSKNMQKFIRQYQYHEKVKSMFSYSRKLASILLIIMGISFSLLLQFSEVRAACQTVFTNIYDKYIEFFFFPVNNTNTEKLEVGFLPDGFSLISTQALDTEYSLYYMNDIGDTIKITRLTQNYSIYIDNEHYDISSIKIGERDCTYFESTNKKFENKLTWNDADNFFIISSTLDKETIIEIVKNIK